MSKKVIEPFPCTFCGVELTDYCVNCSAFYRGEQSIKPAKAEYMTGDDRAAEMQKIQGRISVTFDLMHQRIEQLVGRPVWTHEMGLNWEGLVEEARNREHPTIQEIAELIPEEKRIIVSPETL